MDRLDITQSGRRSALGTLAAISPAFVALPIVFLMLTLYSASAWAQTTITPGDIIVVFGNAFGGSGGIIKVDPVTKAQTPIACNPGASGCPITGTPGFFDEPVALAIESNGNILVTDRTLPGVIRVNPLTGAQSVVFSGSPLVDPFGLTIGALGAIYITDTGCTTHGATCPNGTANAKVYRITSGAATLVSTGQFLKAPYGIDAENTGTLVVTDSISNVLPLTGAGGIIRIDPGALAGSNQSVVSVGTAGVSTTMSDGCPFGIAVDPLNGNIFNSVWNPTAFPPLGCAPGAIWRANPLVFDTNVVVSPHDQVAWMAPFGMAVDTDTSILIVDEFYRALYRMSQAGALIGVTQPFAQFTEAPTDVNVYTANNLPPPLNPADADLSLTKTDSPDPVNAGAQLTYTLTVTNGGPNTAANVKVTDQLPPGVTFVSVSGTGWNCGESNGTVTCTVTTLAKGTAPAITIVVTAPSEPTTLTNTATVTSTTNDPNTTNNSATATTTVNGRADLSLTKTDSPDPVTAGGALTYTLTVNNGGPSTAQSVSVSDPLPAGVTFVSATGAGWTCPQTSGTVTCTRPSLAPGAAPPITINVTAPSEPGTLTNTATVTSSTTDPNTANNSATATTTVVGSADLSIIKTDSPDPVTTGGTLTYTLNVTNAGPSTAQTVTVKDPLPTNVTFVSATGAGWTCSQTNGTVTCTRPQLARGAAPAITINVTAPSYPCTLTNTATVSASSPDDPNKGNNSSTATTTVVAPATSADLMITKADRPDPVATNATLVYTLTIRNNGPNAAQSVTVTDNLPATVTFQSVSASGWNCTRSGQTVTCTRASMNPGTSSTISIYVKAPSQPGTITNTASVTSATFDPVPGNNSDSETTTVIQQVTPAKWTGSGKIRVNGGYATFGFTVKKKKNGVVQGQLDFDNLVTKLDVDSISITSLVVSGNTATFSGTVRERSANGPSMGPYNFTVTVQDNGDPGKGRDTFRIQISDPYGTNEGGTLTQGNIEQNTWDSRDDNDDRE